MKKSLNTAVMPPLDPMMRAMWGIHARHVAFNLVIQDAEDNRAALVGTTCFAKEMGYGFTRSHCLLLCDAIIRPHMVIESDHLRGTGLAAMVTSGALSGVTDWLDNGRVILNNLPRRGEEDPHE